MYYTTKPSFGVWGLGFRVQGPGSTASVAEELPLEELCLASDMFERKQEFSRLFKDSERERDRERQREREQERERERERERFGLPSGLIQGVI